MVRHNNYHPCIYQTHHSQWELFQHFTSQVGIFPTFYQSSGSFSNILPVKCVGSPIIPSAVKQYPAIISTMPATKMQLLEYCCRQGNIVYNGLQDLHSHTSQYVSQPSMQPFVALYRQWLFRSDLPLRLSSSSAMQQIWLIFLQFLRRYREVGTSADWSRVTVSPSGSTFITVNNLKPSTLYEFQIVGKNSLGDGLLSKIITAKTSGTFQLMLSTHIQIKYLENSEYF